MNIPKYYGYKYYAGDPCYVIDDDRWGEFCTALWDGEKENKDNGFPEYPVIIEWDYLDKNECMVSCNIEVWNSPNGDGVWNFSNTVKQMDGWIAGTEMGVDAGLLAIVPYGAISNNSTCSDKDDVKEISNLGIIFTEEPILETGMHVVGEVRLNDNDENNVYYCYNCGEHIYEHDVIDCENYNCMGCHMCFECECEEE